MAGFGISPAGRRVTSQIFPQRMAGICLAPAELRTNAGLRCGKIWEVTLRPACGYYGADAPT